MPERILVIGPPGAGKSYNLLKIARFVQPSGAQVHVLDTDGAYPRMLKEFPDLQNVHATFAYDWQDYVGWLESTLKVAVPGRDWVAVDRVDKAWQRVQNFVSEEVYEQSLAERLLEARKRMKKRAMVVSPSDQADWQTINAQYSGWFLQLMYKTRCHIYLVASVRTVREEDEEEVKDLYGAYGVRPEGQKALAYEPDTVFLLTCRRRQWFITIIKDRGRPYYERQPLADLAKQYLGLVAGWRDGREP